MFAFAISTVFVGCNSCQEFDTMPEFDQLQNIPGFEEVNLDCTDDVSLPRTQIVSSDSVYRALFSPYLEQLTFCGLDSLPEIDFDNRILIWSITTDVVVDKVVTREGNTVKHIVKVKTSSFASTRYRMNAVAIPKLAESDTLEFVTVIYGCE